MDKLITQIRSASRKMVRQLGLLENVFVSIGSTSQCHALVELDAHGTMNLNQLSTALNLEKSTISRLVTQLADKGICHIEPDEKDRRNKLITLTKKGLRLVSKINHEATTQVRQALEMMSDEEQNIVVRGLSIYAKALKRSRLQNEYKARKLLKKDVPELAILIRQVRAEFGFDAKHPMAHLFEEELNQIYETYNKDKSGYFVLVHNNKIVGGAGYAPFPGYDTTCELKGMYLAPQLRGLGLGALLLRTVLQKTKDEGFTQCYLETMCFMEGANALYKKFGFKPLEKPLGDTGHNWTDCWYIKEI